MSAPERIWAERRTLPGDPAENGYWEARPLLKHTMAEYIRADLAKEAERRAYIDGSNAGWKAAKGEGK